MNLTSYHTINSCHASFTPGFISSPENRVDKITPAASEKDFKLIYNSCQPRIYQVALRYLKSSIEAQEVVEEVFLKFRQERNNIKSDTPVEAWLYTTAKNYTIKRLKRKAVDWKAMK